MDGRNLYPHLVFVSLLTMSMGRNQVKLFEKSENGDNDTAICVLSFLDGQTLADFRVSCA